MIAFIAGVERTIFWQPETLFMPLAAAILMMIISSGKVWVQVLYQTVIIIPASEFRPSPNREGLTAKSKLQPGCKHSLVPIHRSQSQFSQNYLVA